MIFTFLKIFIIGDVIFLFLQLKYYGLFFILIGCYWDKFD